MDKNRIQFAYIILNLIKDIGLIFSTVLITGYIFSDFPSISFWTGLILLLMIAVIRILLKDKYFK